jgi:hypothetical protein
VRRIDIKHVIMLEGELLDEHTIRIEKALSGVTGKFKLVVELPGIPRSATTKEDFRRHFMEIKVDMSSFKFDRDEANER